MSNYLSELHECLKSLESFDSTVFISDNKCSQALCNFILTLAVIWNDFKNLNVYLEYVENASRDYEIKEKIHPISGELSGHVVYLKKAQIALVRELFKVIRDNHKVLEDATFKGIYKKMPQGTRGHWDELVNISINSGEITTKFSKLLARIRDKMINHYDSKEIFKGYQEYLLGTTKTTYITRGSQAASRRFYFADAAVECYMKQKVDEFSDKGESGSNDITYVCKLTNHALAIIVDTFIQHRSAFRNVCYAKVPQPPSASS